MTPILAKRLFNGFRGELLFEEPLAKHTTFHIGGPAEVFAIPSNSLDLIILLKSVFSDELPVLVLGNGSKLLVREGGWPGLALSLRKGFNSLHIAQEDEEGSTVFRVGAGFYLPKLAWIAAEQGLGGLEFACGIPSTIGGAVCMNIGADSHSIVRLIQSLNLYDYEGKSHEFFADELMITGRSCTLPIKGVITEVSLKLSPDEPDEIKNKMKLAQKYRLNTQPVLTPCTGPVFKDPGDQKAAKLIEEAGLKGKIIGQARISDVHANYIVNMGGASASDVLSLMELVQKTVFERVRIMLDPEIQIVGKA